MLKNLNTAVDYICEHPSAFVIISFVTTVAVGVLVFDKEFKMSLLPRTPKN